jgi:hypothetical protein
MARFIVVAALVALASTSAFAQTANPDFVTVDSLGVSGSTLNIVGIVEEGQAPVSRSLSFANVVSGMTINERLTACKELAFVAMSKPGQYHFKAIPGSFPACGLVRVNP